MRICRNQVRDFISSCFITSKIPGRCKVKEKKERHLLIFIYIIIILLYVYIGIFIGIYVIFYHIINDIN